MSSTVIGNARLHRICFTENSNRVISYETPFHAHRHLSNKILTQQNYDARYNDGFYGIMKRRAAFANNYERLRMILPNRNISKGEILFPHSSKPKLI